MNMREIILGIAIFVLTLFVTSYGVNMFFDKPQYEDYCLNEFRKVPLLEENVCLNSGGKWIPTNMVEDEISGYCDIDFTCREDYEKAQEHYSVGIFLIAVPLGILLILFGAYFFSLNAVGVGIMAGGIGTLLRGVGSYWVYSEDWIRFLISLIGLTIVIYFSYKFKDIFELKVNKKKKRK